MTTNRYAQYNTTTGEILDIITRTVAGWAGDYPNPPGTALLYLNELVVDYDLHYVHVGPGDDYIIDRPFLSMGIDLTIEGDGTTQDIATGLPSGTLVYRNETYQGTFSGTLTWDPVSPDDNGVWAYDLVPPFPDRRERILITVIDP